MELSMYLRDYSRTIEGKQQLIIAAFAKALEVIPRQLCDNAGMDATDILNRLRQKHASAFAKGSLDGRWFGVDIVNSTIGNTFDAFVWEPALVKINLIGSAVEAACVVLSVDETVKNQPSEAPGNVAMRGRGAAPGR